MPSRALQYPYRVVAGHAMRAALVRRQFYAVSNRIRKESMRTESRGCASFDEAKDMLYTSLGIGSTYDQAVKSNFIFVRSLSL